MTPAVKTSIEEVQRQFLGHVVVVAEDANGGAFVIVEDVPLGPPYAQSSTWIGFHITFNCPYADTYPHFVDGGLSRLDAAVLGDGMASGMSFPISSDGQASNIMAPGTMPVRDAVQVSRRSNRRDSTGLETPNLKLLKVLEWIRSR